MPTKKPLKSFPLPVPRYFLPISPDYIPSSSPKFTLLSYNVLHYVSVHSPNYTYCSREFFLKSHRKRLLCAEIESLDPDIVCLQEVSHLDTDWKPFFRKNKYMVYFSNRSHSGHIFRYGLLTAYKTERFVPHSLTTITLPNPACRARFEPYEWLEFFQDKLSQIVVFSLKERPEEKFLVCNNHIYFSPLLEYVKVKQIFSVITYLFNSKKKIGDTPIVLVGDFNSKHDSTMYSMLTSQPLADIDMTFLHCPFFRDEEMDALPLPKTVRSKAEAMLARQKFDVGQIKAKRVADVRFVASRINTMDLFFESVYSNYAKCVDVYKNEYKVGQSEKVEERSRENGEPLFTNYQGDFHETIDYIFLEKKQTKIRATRVLSMPSENEVKKEVEIPSSVFGSDHLSLMVEFELNI